MILETASDHICADEVQAPAMSGELRQLTPGERLVFGILTQAIRDYLYGGRGVRADAEEWFTSEAQHEQSFRWCCAVLNLDADFIWAHRDRWRLAQNQKGSRTTVVAMRAAA